MFLIYEEFILRIHGEVREIGNCLHCRSNPWKPEYFQLLDSFPLSATGMPMSSGRHSASSDVAHPALPEMKSYWCRQSPTKSQGSHWTGHSSLPAAGKVRANYLWFKLPLCIALPVAPVSRSGNVQLANQCVRSLMEKSWGTRGCCLTHLL